MARDRARFIEALLTAVRERVAAEPDDDIPLVLAAHLFAACEILGIRERDVEDAPPVDPVGSLLGVVRIAPGQLLAHLLALDALLGGGPVERGEVPLTPVRKGGFTMAGAVLYAPRGPTPLRARRETGDHPIAWDRPGQLLRHVHLWWSRPDEPVDLRHLPACADDGRPWALDSARSLRVLLAPLPGVLPPSLRVCRRGPRWGFQATESGGRIPPEVRDRVAAAVAEGRVDLLVLPELLVEPADLTWIESLGLRATIAGSWHVSGPRGVRNEAPLVDRRGRRGVHAKRGRFALRAARVTELLARGSVTVDDGPLPPLCEVEEAFDPGAELLLFDTPLGRASLVICADLLDVGDCLPGLMDRLAPDLLFVVAMSPVTDDFRARMDALAHLGTATLLVNAAEVAGKAAAVAALRLPWKGDWHRVEVRKDVEMARPDASACRWVEDVGLLVDLGAIVQWDG